METKMFQCHTEMHEQGIMLYFSGPVCQSVVEGLGEMMRQKMAREERGLAVARRVFAVLVEQMQNIINYSGTIPLCAGVMPAMGEGQVVVGRKGSEFFITCGNPVLRATEPRIKEKIDTINRMNKDELKRYYKEQRRKEPDELSRGAGLGFIEMARKASHPLAYSFEPINDTMSYFAVNVRIAEEE
ncbi:SiaB family protein kinase [Oleidesulfovibrio sp.]|uniref:SiaB family protein kinase n=1 Tax=Oleidesulfovibrio sp. TaxID=2909707 RepID=UPI003A841101